MPPRSRASRLPIGTASPGRVPASVRADFYREEFVKHQRCLEQQREFYSERAICEVEAALTRVIAQLEQLSTREDFDRLASQLLRKFDLVTGLSAWSDPKNVH